MLQEPPDRDRMEIKYCFQTAKSLRSKATFFKLLHLGCVFVVAVLPLFGLGYPAVVASGGTLIPVSGLVSLPVIFSVALTLVHGRPLLVAAKNSYEMSLKFEKVAEGFSAVAEHPNEDYRRMQRGKLRAALNVLKNQKFAHSLDFLQQISNAAERLRRRGR